jgi:hypothetical protein
MITLQTVLLAEIFTSLIVGDTASHEQADDKLADDAEHAYHAGEAAAKVCRDKETTKKIRRDRCEEAWVQFKTAANLYFDIAMMEAEKAAEAKKGAKAENAPSGQSGDPSEIPTNQARNSAEQAVANALKEAGSVCSELHPRTGRRASRVCLDFVKHARKRNAEIHAIRDSTTGLGYFGVTDAALKELEERFDPPLPSPNGPKWGAVVTGSIFISTIPFMAAAIVKTSEGGDLHRGIVNIAMNNGEDVGDVYDVCTNQAKLDSPDFRLRCDDFQKWYGAKYGLIITASATGALTAVLLGVFLLRRKAVRERGEDSLSVRVAPDIRFTGTGASLGIVGRF